MALFMDSPVVGLEDLAAQDTGILDVAASEGIDLERKILIARDEIAIEMESALVRSGLAKQGDGFASKLVVTPALRLYDSQGGKRWVLSGAREHPVKSDGGKPQLGTSREI